jgi:hypothetical protein
VSADVAAEGEHGAEIHLEYAVPFRGGELVCWVPRLDAGAVEEDVDLVTVFKDCGNELRDSVLGGEVAGVDLGFAAEGLDGGFGLLVGGIALEWS